MKTEYKSVFIGGVKLAEPLLKKLLCEDSGLQAVFCPSGKRGQKNSDYCNFRDLVGTTVSYYEYDDLNSADVLEKLSQFSPTVIYVIGVSQLVSDEILKLPVEGCLGGHIAELPRNRGRHPIIWTLANGLSESAVSVIWLDNGVDSGDIADQRCFSISEDENAGDIYQRVADFYAEMIGDTLLPGFIEGDFPRKTQNLNGSNIWRGRKFQDGVIDWRMSARRIHNLIRALYHPYPGAAFRFNDEHITVWKSEVDKAKENLEPGKVLEIKESSILIKCGEGALWLLEHNLDHSLISEGDYLF